MMLPQRVLDVAASKGLFFSTFSLLFSFIYSFILFFESEKVLNSPTNLCHIFDCIVLNLFDTVL